MTENEYLQAVLTSQTIEENGPELKELRSRRLEVEKLLRQYFDGLNPTIRYGGSKAKGKRSSGKFRNPGFGVFPFSVIS